MILAFVLMGVAPAGAQTSVKVEPTFPPTTRIGETFPASIAIRNLSGQSVYIGRVVLLGSCSGGFPLCPADPGVFELSTTGAGVAGPTSCLGMWAIATSPSGAFRFTPPGGDWTPALAPGDSCQIDYTVTTKKMPAVDDIPPSPPVDIQPTVWVDAGEPTSSTKVYGSDRIAVFPRLVTTTTPSLGPQVTGQPGVTVTTTPTVSVPSSGGPITTATGPGGTPNLITTVPDPPTTVPDQPTTVVDPTTTVADPGSALPVAQAAIVAGILLLGAIGLLLVLRRPRRDGPPMEPLPVVVSKRRGPRTHSEVADDELGDLPVRPLAAAGPAAARFAEACRDDDVATPLIATLLWDAFITDEGFPRALHTTGASARAAREGRFIVVRHAAGTRYDLLVFDPGFSGDPVSSPVDLLPCATTAHNRRNELVWNDLLAFERRDPWRAVDENTILMALREAAQSAEFGVVIAKPPRVLMTCCPSPARPISIDSHGRERVTMGAALKARDGSLAVTTVLHGLRKEDDEPAGRVVGRSVTVGNRRGTVISVNEVTDSCLIAVSDFPVSPKWPGSAGPLSGVTPRQNETTKFDGIASGARTTTVTSWDRSILHRQGLLGSKVYTTPDTRPGDSGAALIDGSEHMLGFAVYRSAFGEPIVDATWVWADQVFQAHGARMPGTERAVT